MGFLSDELDRLEKGTKRERTKAFRKIFRGNSNYESEHRKLMKSHARHCPLKTHWSCDVWKTSGFDAKEMPALDKEHNAVTLAQQRTKSWFFWEIDLSENTPENRAKVLAELKRMAKEDFPLVEVSSTKHGFHLKGKMPHGDKQLRYFYKKYNDRFGGDYLPPSAPVPHGLREVGKYEVNSSLEISPKPKVEFSNLTEETRPKSPVRVIRVND